MKPTSLHRLLCGGLLIAVAVIALPAQAARVGVLSNNFSTQTAADFNARITGHVFTGVDTAATVPTTATLTAAFDVLLVFEDGTYPNAPATGAAVAGFANSGRTVVLGTFYEQDRTDGPAANNPNGWGPLEAIDPNNGDGVGTPKAPRTLNIATLTPHPLTQGITALASTQWAGGNAAKPGTTVVAYWTQPNARGAPDPAIAYRITGSACVIHIAIAPQYPSIGTAGVDFSGDFYRVWKNAFDYGVSGCALPGAASDLSSIPTLSSWGLLLTLLLVTAVAFSQRRRIQR